MPLFIALYALWALLLFGGFVVGRPSSDGVHRMPTWTRMASSAVLALAAWLGVYLLRPTPLGRYALFIAVGMTLGLLGDLLMVEVISPPQHVLFGMAAFGLGHIAYIVAALALPFGSDAPGLRWGALGIWLAVGAVGWYVAVARGQKPSALTLAALPYALLLASVAGLFCGVALQSSLATAAAVGAALFLVSDLILARQLFRGWSFPLIGDIIWLLYGPGQALIVASMVIIAHLAGVGPT